MADSALKEFLSRTPFFGGLQDQALERVIAMLVERQFAVGATVFREGEQGRSMYIVHSGELLARQCGTSGRVLKLMRLKPGDFFGETTLIEMQPRPFSAVVEQEALLYELTNADLYKLYREDLPSYAMVLQNINRELCRRLRKAGKKLIELADHAEEEEVTQLGGPLPRQRR
jgi:CRP-like cAMP-binding protein